MALAGSSGNQRLRDAGRMGFVRRWKSLSEKLPSPRHPIASVPVPSCPCLSLPFRPRSSSRVDKSPPTTPTLPPPSQHPSQDGAGASGEPQLCSQHPSPRALSWAGAPTLPHQPLPPPRSWTVHPGCARGVRDTRGPGAEFSVCSSRLAQPGKSVPTLHPWLHGRGAGVCVCVVGGAHAVIFFFFGKVS